MKNDTETIVKEFLELWQKQFAYMSRDEASVNQGLDAFQKMQDAYVNAISAGLENTGNAKSATTSDIFRNIGNEFAMLAQRYAELERRIAKLESAINGGGGDTTKKAPKNKPA